MLKTDCLYFESDRPCVYHKQKGVICSKCGFYQKPGKKILIIKLGALGDVLRTTSLIKPLYQKYLGKAGFKPLIYWVTQEKAVPVLENIQEIREILPFNSVTLARLLIEKFHLMLNLDLTRDALALSAIVSADEKKGFGLDKNSNPVYLNPEAEEWFEMSFNDSLKKKNKKTYQQHIFNIAGLNLTKNNSQIIINLNEREKQFANSFSRKHSLSKNHINIGLNTGGGTAWKKKEWPVKHTITLIKKLKAGTRGKKTGILLFGGEKEEERNNFILTETGRNVIDTGTHNSIREFFALLSLCDLIVTTDTLALHAALALGKKAVALFGPTSATEIEMYGRGGKIVTPVECKVCYRRQCFEKPDCMDSIPPELVYKTIQKLIQK